MSERLSPSMKYRIGVRNESEGRTVCELTEYVSVLLAEIDRVNGSFPSRFRATPAQVHAFLAEHLAEDTHLRYQQAIGGRAASEAAKDVRMESNTPLASALYTNGMLFAADHIDPLKGGGPFPSSLIRLDKTGGTS